MKKFDEYLYNQITLLIKKWIKKHKFQKHKYDYIIRVSYVEMFMYGFIGIALAGGMAYKGHYYAAGGLIAIWGLFVGLDYMRIGHLKEIKEHYDWLWAMRKHPEVYENIKHLCKMNHEDQYSYRKFILPLYFLFIAVQAITFSPP